ncbi:hypothetical protein ABZ845_29395 [Streptomyces sp. NPDC047022]|uniref:hypothetical protein n=1 Tax=Streptomyces sp. NPDC047022 TaxID=3155737 RepID=UPI0033DFD22F
MHRRQRPSHRYRLPQAGADGTTKKIKDVRIGDVVLAPNPETGRTEGHTVTRTIFYTPNDTDFADVVISAGQARITWHKDGKVDKNPFA